MPTPWECTNPVPAAAELDGRACLLQELNSSIPARASGIGLAGMQAMKPFVSSLLVSDGMWVAQHDAAQLAQHALAGWNVLWVVKCLANRHSF